MGSGLLTEDHLAREALQGAVMAGLFTGSLARHLVLKGGLAMRESFGTGRMTKDIDLDCDNDSSMEMIRNLVRKGLKSAICDSLIESAKISEPKMTDTTMRWKIVGSVPGGESSIHLTIEISRRERSQALEAEVEERKSGLRIYSGDALAMLKTNALLAENRVAPRDLFDLFVLVSADMRPPKEMLAERSDEELRRMTAEVWSKIDLMDWRLAKTELVPFLTPETAREMSEERWEEMRLVVGEAVERWLTDEAEGRAKKGGPK